MLRKTIVTFTVLCGVLAMGPASYAQVSGTPGEAVASLTAPQDVEDTYGGASDTSYVIGAYEFDPFTTATTNIGGQPGTGDRFPTTAGAFLLAAVHIPNGAIVNRIEVQGCDTGAGTINATLFSNTTTGGTQSETSHGGVSTTGTPGCNFFSAALTPFTITNQTRTYYVQVTTAAVDNTARFSAVRLFYRLQVSAAPATATFPNDVPTTHPFFRFVEALARSGISGGCGTGSFCPNDPVTRGQMAVFLATALGLHFPN
jgi:hypothetical protein